MLFITRRFSVLSRMKGEAMDKVISADLEAVPKAIQLLKSGHVVALPTDTVYGIAADAKCDTAVMRLYHIKSRDLEKPIAICVGETRDVNQWGDTRSLPSELLDSLLPGPVTLLLKRSKDISLNLNPGVDKVGIRVPDSDFIRQVASGLGSAVALTSANLSEEPSTLSVQEFQHLWPQLGATFDAGHLGPSRAGSTIVDLTVPGAFSIVRPGSALNDTINKLTHFGLKQLPSS